MRTNRKLLVSIAIAGTFLLAASIWFFFWGSHSFWSTEGESFWALLHSKGHWFLELFIGLLEMVVVDLFLGLIVWKLLLKPYLAERQAKLIADEHERHGLADHDELPSVEQPRSPEETMRNRQWL